MRSKRSKAWHRRKEIAQARRIIERGAVPDAPDYTSAALDIAHRVLGDAAPCWPDLVRVPK